MVQLEFKSKKEKLYAAGTYFQARLYAEIAEVFTVLRCGTPTISIGK